MIEIKLTCEICSEIFTRTTSAGARKYCTTKCSNKAKNLNIDKSYNASYHRTYQPPEKSGKFTMRHGDIPIAGHRYYDK